ncbi:MAG: hypothetical protein V1711_00830 [bacterium]
MEVIMPHRHGEKFRGPHTTCTDFAAEVADVAVRIEEVTGVSPGIIKRGNGRRKVQIEDSSGGLLLTVHQLRSMQELRIFGINIPAIKFELARTLRNQKIAISFKH